MALPFMSKRGLLKESIMRTKKITRHTHDLGRASAETKGIANRYAEPGGMRDFIGIASDD
jgi:hypothetical protein